MREITKKLLGYGARAPKELMLFVKNMMFLNSATAMLAPDLDMLAADDGDLHVLRARRTATRSCGRSGSTRSYATPDPDAMQAAFMVDAEVETLTFRDLQARRDDVRRKVQSQRQRRRRARTAGRARRRRSE